MVRVTQPKVASNTKNQRFQLMVEPYMVKMECLPKLYTYTNICIYNYTYRYRYTNTKAFLILDNYWIVTSGRGAVSFFHVSSY